MQVITKYTDCLDGQKYFNWTGVNYVLSIGKKQQQTNKKRLQGKAHMSMLLSQFLFF